MKVLWVRKKKGKGVDFESQKREKKMVSLGRDGRSQKEGATQGPQCRAWKEAAREAGGCGRRCRRGCRGGCKRGCRRGYRRG